jgi:hypothetical protein
MIFLLPSRTTLWTTMSMKNKMAKFVSCIEPASFGRFHDIQKNVWLVSPPY